MTKHNFKLQYFAVRARGEHLKYILAYSGVDHELEDIDLDDWRAGRKAETPFGNVPCLVVDGNVKIGKSMVIGQFLAAELGLAGKSHVEAAKVFMLANGIYDYQESLVDCEVIQHLLNVWGTQDFVKAKKLFVDNADRFKKFCGQYENFLKQNGGQWLVGNCCSWADLFLELMQRIELCLDSKALDDYPLIKALTERVHEIPNIKKRVEDRYAMQAKMPGNAF